MNEILEVHPERYSPPTSTAWHHSPASNTAAVLTFAAVPNCRQAVYKIIWSYDSDPTGGQLTVTTGGEVLFQVDVTVGGPGFIPILVTGKLNQNLVITLAAGGAGVSGKVNVEKQWSRVR